MSELEKFIDALVDFIKTYQFHHIPQFYYDALFNYLAVTLKGSQQEAVSIVADTFTKDGTGDYQPLGRNEKLSLSNCVYIDCLSSAILAYDDIHFQTGVHPCGPVASCILAVARLEKLSLKEVLEALCIGMEIECRMAVALFDNQKSALKGWYPTGIVGGIGAVAAIARLYHFTNEQTKSAMALAATYASGVRGTHGSMAGSIVPAIASQNGFIAAMLIKNGLTCHVNAITGQNGLICQITDAPAINTALKGLSQTFISMQSSCKMYPYGFISYAAIASLKNKHITYEIESITVEVSPYVALLGSQSHPQTMYDAFVSLPYIVAKVIVDPKRITKPLDEFFYIDQKTKEIIDKISIKANPKMQNNEAKIMIKSQDKIHTYECHQAPGSQECPTTHLQVIQKFKCLMNKNCDKVIHHFYHQDISDIYDFIISAMRSSYS